MFPLVVAAAALAGGAVCARRLDPGAAPWERLAMGAGLGSALLGFVGFLCASTFGLNVGSIALAAITVVGVPLWAARRWPVGDAPGRAVRKRRGAGGTRKASLSPVTLGLYFGIASIFFIAFFRQAAYEKDGTIATGEWNNMGDLAFHVAITQGFVKGENFPPEHPEFAGARLTYPFLADFVAAIFVAAGAPLALTYQCQSVVMGLAILALLVRWVRVLTRDDTASLIAPILVLLSGGVGFYTLIVEAWERGQPLATAFARPPEHSVTVLWDAWTDVLRWGNTLTAFLLPQRAWLVGLPLALVAWTLWWQAMPGDPTGAKRRLTAAGLVCGLLPLAHAHSFLAMMAVAPLVAVFERKLWPAWVRFFFAAAALALPQLLWLSREAEAKAGSFVAWHYGWSMPKDAGLSLAQFWLVNLGLMLPLAIAGLVWRHGLVSPRLRRFLLPFALCFVVPNFVRLSPWEWDTNKVMFYGILALTVPVALLLSRMWRGGIPARIVAVVAFVALTLSGALDVWRVVSRSQEWVQFDHDAVAQARLIEAHTPPRARILSSMSANRAVLLTGRRSLVGHLWTMWTHGFDAAPRVDALKRIYAGDPEAGALLRRHRIDYILVGPAERGELTVNEAYLGTLPVVGEGGHARLHRVPAE